MKKTLLLFINPLLLIGSELIVEKKASSQYQTDNYALFNEFDYHGGFTGYLSNAKTDKIIFPETFPILENSFTLVPFSALMPVEFISNSVPRAPLWSITKVFEDPL